MLRTSRVLLTVGQFYALVSFRCDLGTGALQGSAIPRKIVREAHVQMPAELMR